MAVFGERRDYRHWLFFALGSWILVLTRATTGYIAAGAIFAFFLITSAKDLVVRRRLESRRTMALAMLLLGLVVALTDSKGNQDLLNGVLFDKATSVSSVHRTATFSRAIGVFIHSYGIGVGLGSNRAMSMALYILSNLGVPGTALFGCLLFQLYRMTTCSQSHLFDRRFKGPLTAVQAAFAATLIAMVVSGAEITGPQLWLFWGLMLAMVRREWLLARIPNLTKVMLLEPADELIVLEERWAESA
jgi:O-Antigen ligase